jgi:hypothetical protein
MSLNGVTVGTLVADPFAGSTNWALFAASKHQVALIDAATSATPARIAVLVVMRFPYRPKSKQLFCIFEISLVVRFNYRTGRETRPGDSMASSGWYIDSS